MTFEPSLSIYIYIFIYRQRGQLNRLGSSLRSQLLLSPTPLVLALFLAASSLFLCSFFNVFSFLFMLFLCNVIIKNC